MAHGVASAYSFAVSRRVGAVLPVGYRHGLPCWAWLATPAVAAWTSPFSWLDGDFGYDQLKELLPQWLEQWSVPAQRTVLRLALGYHLIASGPQPEIALVAAISGLVLLSEARYVGGKRMTSSKWKKLSTPEQVRKLLTEYSVDLQLNHTYKHLAAVGMAKAAKSNLPTAATDDMHAVLELRNLVAHPTALSRANIPTTAWIEGWRTAGEWLDLALLARLGYVGTYFPRRQEDRWQGGSVLVPHAAHPNAVGL